MSYRQSNFDPNNFEQPGPPLRPYNWVQWAGVVVIACGFCFVFASLAQNLGWISWGPGRAFPGAPLMLVGVSLINSRRAPNAPVDPLQRARNRRAMIITSVICIAVLGVAAVIEFKGA